MLRKHTRRMSLLDEDPTPEQIAAFREVSAEISARIRTLEAQVAALSERPVVIPDLRALHARLTQTEIADVVDRLEAQGDEAGLREVVQDLIVSARVVERRPARRSTWARMAVTWTAQIHTLLDAGLLRLTDGSTPPPGFDRRVYERSRSRRRRAARRAAATSAAATSAAATSAAATSAAATLFR
jgi:hypothetical protein